VSSERLVLRPFRPEDEAAACAAHQELAAEGFTFLLLRDESSRWDEYLARLEQARHGENLPDRFVPSSLLAADVEGSLVGRVSIRHQLNDWLAEFGGHVGYAVRPGFRRRGYATAMLSQALDLTALLGIEDVLVTCDEENVVSARTIEKCGGVFERLTRSPAGEPLRRRYWIPTAGRGAVSGR
jgi:predicted acetyltransferase